MNAATVPSFWEAYQRLPEDIKRSAKKAFDLWKNNPFHPSLRFTWINRVNRVKRGYFENPKP
ncbi:MAG: hypothetical protein D6734_03930 [Candidatus Schekmanbacteria bacterium]|nr:MAG: hypothetical protein D6734_03930 [Candidatus Schekmanbacteria bacterium]